MITEKLKYIRVLRLVMGLSEPELYRKFGRNWGEWSTNHLNRLEALVDERQRKIFNAVGDEDFGAVELLGNLIDRIREEHNKISIALRDRLSRGPRYSAPLKEGLIELLGCSDRDINRVAREIGVRKFRKEVRKGKLRKVQIWWELKDED